MSCYDTERNMEAMDVTVASPQQIIAFKENDPENPYNWSKSKKLLVEFIGILLVINSVLDSSIPSGAQAQIGEHFGVEGEQLVLPTSIFLIGYVLGPLVFAPLSESNGRRNVLVVTFFAFLMFSLGVCFAPNWPAFIILRLLAGIFASPALSIPGGLYADIYADPARKGRAIAFNMSISSAGPSLAPLCSGYLAKYGWRWPFWFTLILAVPSFTILLCLPETFGPAILQRKAEKLRKDVPQCNVFAPIELESVGARQKIKSYAGRPLRMLFTEPIVSFSCLFLSLIYAVQFILYEAYPIAFPSLYGFDEGEVGLAFLPICLGCILAMPVYLLWDTVVRNAQRRDALWSYSREKRRLPLSLAGGPFFTAGLFWIGWGSQSNVHWIIPILGGLPLGFGFVLIFMALINYMADAYGIYAASALGAASIARSTFGVVLPFATHSMFDRLGVPWACSLLGFISFAMSFIPFAFLRYGPIIRQKSRMCQELAEKTSLVDSR